MADELDPAQVAQIAEQFRRSLGGAMVQIGGDLQKLDRLSKDAVGPSGGIGKLDAAFTGITSRLLGPVGLVAGLYQISNALGKVATESVQLQAFSRNTGIATDNIKNMQLQLQMMGKSSAEAKATIGQLAGTLNDFNVNQQGSSLYQTLLGKEGGADVVKNLNSAKTVTEQIAVIMRTYQAQTSDRGRRHVAGIFNMEPAEIEGMIRDKNLVALTFKANEEALEKYHRASVIFSHNVDEAYKAISGHVISALNDITGGVDGSKETFTSAVTIINEFTTTFLSSTDSVLIKMKATFEEIKNIKAAIDAMQGDDPRKGKEGARNLFDAIIPGLGQSKIGEWGNLTPYELFSGERYEGTNGEAIAPNSMGGGRRSKPNDYRLPGFRGDKRSDMGTSGATDFSGMRRTQSIEEEQNTTLTDIRDTLKRMEEKGGGSGGGGDYAGGGRQGLGRHLGVDTGSSGSGNSSAAFTGKGATGRGTATAMAAAKDQLRKEGVPEANLDHAAAMLVGQAQAESSLNPNASHDNGTGYGVYGARNERRTGMMDWLKENGYASNSLEGQMKYMAHEAMTGKDYGPSRKALMGASPETMATGTNTLTTNFERPLRNNSGARLAHANAALNAGITPAPGSETGGTTFGGSVRERQQGAVRRGAIDSKLRTAFDYASSKTGLTVDVTSGGQRMPGAPGAVGSHRHDRGRAADFNLRDADGNIVSPNDPRALEFYRYAGQAGVTGGGEGYMNDPNKIHLDHAGSIYAGSAAFRRALTQGQGQQDQFQAAARARMDAAKASGTENSLNAKVEFSNVPNGVKTSVESEGDIFKELQVSKSRQGEVAGGSPGQPYSGVW